jgi:protein TonB
MRPDRLTIQVRAACIFCTALLAACSTPKQTVSIAQPQAAVPAASAPSVLPALTIDGYKKDFARRVARASPDVFSEPLPEMFKSIVVLDITVDRDGRLAHASVRRSNGYKALERRALESVKRAAPFAAPAFTIRRADGSVQFLETFLFRDDGRFRILSLQQA